MTGEDKPGQLVVVSGPSGVGKSTVCRELARRLDAFLSISVTTRPRREHEVDGREYHFIPSDAFERLIDEDGLLEYARVYAGHCYGTPAAPVIEALATGRAVVLEIEIEGTIQVLRRFPEAVSIYVTAPTSGEQASRLVGRAEDTPEAIRERLNKAEAEIQRARACGAYRHFVVNERVDETVEEMIRICREDCAA